MENQPIVFKRLIVFIAFLCLRSSFLQAQYIKLHDFSTPTGARPTSSLVSDSNFFYGTASMGGSTNNGVVFKIGHDGSGYTLIKDFIGGADGWYPLGSMVIVDSFLYGMTYRGGPSDWGTLFKIRPDGTGYMKLMDFTGASNGSYPWGALISDGTFLYGMTLYGGTSNLGTVFKIGTDGTGYVKLLDFTGVATGSAPQGDLVYDGTFLYGLTSQGGTSAKGTLFKIKSDGTAFTKLLDFTGTSNGSNPLGSLVFDGTYLYGMTQNGGTSNKGTVFKIKPDGTAYTKLKEFTGMPNGQNPSGSLLIVGSYLYGMTQLGGINNYGMVFRIKGDGTSYSKLLDFAGTANGRLPYASLISDSTFLYGLTEQGGVNDIGALIKQCIPPDVAVTTSANAVCPGTSVTLTASGADSFSWTGGVTDGVGFVPTATTTYSVTGTTGTMCNSTASVTITVNNNTTSTLTESACDSLTLNSQTYTTSGTYIQHINNFAGCDSAITLYLSINTNCCFVAFTTVYDSLLNTFNLTVETDTLLTTVGYHWDFGDGTSSSLAYPTHVYAQDSLYNVCMTRYTSSGDSCSYCHLIGKDTTGNIIRDAGFSLNVMNPLATGILSSLAEDPAGIYPNPATGVLTVITDRFSSVIIMDMNGKIVMHSDTKQTDISSLSKGVYSVIILSGNNRTVKKLVKM
jgi:uncharacterized repeat protein (TIGR03803 family)